MNAALALAGAATGAIVGSFIATLCVRWPRGEQASAGRSRCDDCGRELNPLDLVPIVSALVARGKCRSCGARIDPLHWKVELAAAVIGGGSLAIAPDARGAALALFCWLLLPSTILDWRYYWLPNRLTATLAVAGLVAGGFLSGVSLIHRLIGAAAGFGALALVAEAYRRVRSREGLGRGDAKLLGAIGLWTGWAVLPAILLAASAIGLAGAAIRQRGPGHAVAFGSLLAAAAAVTGAVMVVFPELLRTG